MSFLGERGVVESRIDFESISKESLWQSCAQLASITVHNAFQLKWASLQFYVKINAVSITPSSCQKGMIVQWHIIWKVFQLSIQLWDIFDTKHNKRCQKNKLFFYIVFNSKLEVKLNKKFPLSNVQTNNGINELLSLLLFSEEYQELFSILAYNLL